MPSRSGAHGPVVNDFVLPRRSGPREVLLHPVLLQCLPQTCVFVVQHRRPSRDPAGAWAPCQGETIGPDGEFWGIFGNHRPVSTGRPLETIDPDRTFSDIFGHWRRITHVCIAFLLSPRARTSRPLSLPPRCAIVMTNAQRARARPLQIPRKTAGKITSPRGLTPPRAQRFRHAKRAARDLRSPGSAGEV